MGVRLRASLGPAYRLRWRRIAMIRVWLTALMLAAASAGAAQAQDFDARRAKDVAAVVSAHGASGALKTSDSGRIYFDGQAGGTYFAVHFQDCDAARTLCKTALFDGSWTTKKVTADQVNRWNRWTLFCPAYIDTDQTPDVWYALSVSAHTDQADLAAAVGTWMGCLKDFDNFVADPDAFMARVNADDHAATSPPAGAPAPH
jgi:hypothetical protein